MVMARKWPKLLMAQVAEEVPQNEAMEVEVVDDMEEEKLRQELVELRNTPTVGASGVYGEIRS